MQWAVNNVHCIVGDKGKAYARQNSWNQQTVNTGFGTITVEKLLFRGNDLIMGEVSWFWLGFWGRCGKHWVWKTCKHETHTFLGKFVHQIKIGAFCIWHQKWCDQFKTKWLKSSRKRDYFGSEYVFLSWVYQDSTELVLNYALPDSLLGYPKMVKNIYHCVILCSALLLVYG